MRTGTPPPHPEGKHSEITKVVIECFYAVHKNLGYGSSERVYENASKHLIERRGLVVEQQAPIPVYFEGLKVGEYFADLLINRLVIVELKAVRELAPEHEAQLLNYLKSTPIEVGLLVNFGLKLTIRRKVCDNPLKGTLSWTNWK